MILFDVDGTIVDSAGALFPQSERLIAACSQEMVVGLCSARPLPSLRNLCSSLRGVSILAASQGAVVARYNTVSDAAGSWTVVDAAPFSCAEVERSIEAARGVQSELFYHGLEEWFVHDVSKAATIEAAICGVGATLLTSKAPPKSVYKIVAVVDDRRQADRLVKTLRRAGLNASTSKPTYVEICSASASTSKGAREIQGILGVSQLNSVAVGDGENDISLLQNSGASFTFKKAPEVLRKIASHVLRDPEEDGLEQLRETIASWNLKRSIDVGIGR